MGALGDVVRTIPAQQALRAQYPEARISWLVERKAADLLRGQADLDEVLEFPREELSGALRRLDLPGLVRQLLAVRRLLRSRHFDLVVDFHAILKSGVLGWLTGAPLRVSYAPPYGREWGWLFANRRAELCEPKLSRHLRNQALLEFLAVSINGVAPAVDPDPAADDRLASVLKGGPAPILIHPGSSPGTPYKRYTEWGYGLVARRLVDAGHRCWVATGSSPEEADLARRIVDASGSRAEIAPATPTLADLSALIRHARLFIGGDSGPLHLAALIGTPVVQILGPTDPVENAPLPSTPARSVRVSVACSPCRRGCADATCMKLIPHDSVHAAAVELLTLLSRPVPRTEPDAIRRDRSGVDPSRSLSRGLLTAPAP